FVTVYVVPGATKGTGIAESGEPSKVNPTEAMSSVPAASSATDGTATDTFKCPGDAGGPATPSGPSKTNSVVGTGGGGAGRFGSGTSSSPGGPKRPKRSARAAR